MAAERKLVSGTGRGIFRYYQVAPGKDWELRIDSDFSSHFSGEKYHVALTYSFDRFRGNKSERIVFDGQTVRSAWFSPFCHPTGAQGLISTPEIPGHGIARPATGSFFWDITKLARNVWNPERLFQVVGPPGLEFKETPEGDIIGTYSKPRGKTRDRVQFECPRRFGYDIASFQAFNGDEGEQPVQNSRLEWKQSAGGLWYVRSLDETFVFRDQDGSRPRVRQVLKFTAFEPNVKVDASMFTEESLDIPDGTSIIDNQVGHKRSSSLYRKKR